MPPKQVAVKPADGTWLFTAMQYISAPAYININQVAAGMKTKPHNITCKISDLRKRYGLNIAGTTKDGGESGPRKGGKQLPPPAPMDSVKAADIEWFTQAVRYVNNALVIQINEVATAMKTKPHNVTCKISSLRKQYGLKLAGTSQGGASSSSNSGSATTSTQALPSRKTAAPQQQPISTKPPTSRITKSHRPKQHRRTHLTKEKRDAIMQAIKDDEELSSDNDDDTVDTKPTFTIKPDPIIHPDNGSVLNPVLPQDSTAASTTTTTEDEEDEEDEVV